MQDHIEQDLTFAQKFFLKYYCYPPPGRKYDEYKRVPANGDKDPLARFKEVFGPEFTKSIKDKVVVDIGCGTGKQVIGLAKEGARKVIGIDNRPIFSEQEELTANTKLDEKVKFTLSTIPELKQNSVDVAISQNSFEHFSEPDVILKDTFHLLKKGGRFYITFSPPWLNPFGVHMFFMIKYPWAHFLFSEKTILTVRRLYRNDKPLRYEDIDGGLNKMTIMKFKKIIKEKSGFTIRILNKTPIRRTPGIISTIPVLNEFITARVSAVLEKI